MKSWAIYERIIKNQKWIDWRSIWPQADWRQQIQMYLNSILIELIYQRCLMPQAPESGSIAASHSLLTAKDRCDQGINRRSTLETFWWSRDKDKMPLANRSKPLKNIRKVFLIQRLTALPIQTDSTPSMPFRTKLTLMKQKINWTRWNLLVILIGITCITQNA